MKKTLSSILLFAFMTAVCDAQILVGDMNGDSSLDVSDITAIVNTILGSSEIQYITETDFNLSNGSEVMFVRGDMNGDGIVNVSDVTMAVSSILGFSELQFITESNFVADIHECVDLGLPSGTLWATCNIGAKSPEDFGDFFAWGETEGYINGKTIFNWNTYKWCNSGNSNRLTKYCTNSSYGSVDNKKELELVDDVAYISWGNEWRMPNATQLSELINGRYTVVEWINQKDINGLRITSKSNGNSIFLPAAGCRYEDYYGSADLQGRYWLRTFESDNSRYAGCFISDSCEVEINGSLRSWGFSVRPVKEPKAPTLIEDLSGSIEGLDYVDLGLPSSTLWATANIGANYPEDYGDYFAWGETKGYNSGKTSFSWSTYRWGTSNYLSKYCTSSENGIVDNKTELEPEDDAAYVNWGSIWRMPSYEQCQELFNSNYTKKVLTTQNGVYGAKITSRLNGNSIFLPAAGWKTDIFPDYAGSYGYFWSRTLFLDNSSIAWRLGYNSNGFSYGTENRKNGLSIRPVLASNDILVTNITLNVSSVTLRENTNYQLTATVTANTSLIWNTSDVNVATVSSNGLLSALGAGMATITCSATDGSGASVMCTVVVLAIEEHEYVDLGLPSGTLWATSNIGAEKPEDYGDYFAWGETEGYNSGVINFNWSSYKWCNGINTALTKYSNSYGIVDNKTELEFFDDAAYVNCGLAWRMPSREQFNELINSSNTNTEWTTLNGVYGYKITSKFNGLSIFLPAAGECYNSSFNYEGTAGRYWSRTLYPNNSICACSLLFGSSSIVSNANARCYGYSVRPVRFLE